MNYMENILRKLYGRIYNRCSFCSYLEVRYLRLRKELGKIKNYKENKRIEKLIKEILEYYKETNNRDIKEILKYLKKYKNKTVIFNCSDMQENIKIEVKYDENKELFYIYHLGKKMYFSKKFKLGERVKNYYKSLILEQEINSSHRYISENFKLDGVKCLVDAGGAEGIFSLENLDKVEKIYIFECDEDWVEALEATFEEYKEKVKIIKKFVSDKNNKTEITFDEFQKSINEKIDYIKMDIEGAEVSALRGSKNILKENNDLKIIVCVYHKNNDEKDIKEILKNFKIEISNGYALLLNDKKIEPPYFRRGVIRASK